MFRHVPACSMFQVLSTAAISFVSFYIEDGKMLQAHYFDFLSKNFGKIEKFVIVLKENNGEPSVIAWRISHIWKTGVVPTFGSCCS